MHEVSNFVEIFVKLTKTLGIKLQLRLKELGLLSETYSMSKYSKVQNIPHWLHQLRQYFIIIENILSISDIKIVDALTYFFRQAQVIVDFLAKYQF